MKIKTVCILLFLMLFRFAFPQAIRIEAGMVSSKINQFDDCKSLVTFSPLIGIDYCVHKHWELSNEISYMTKGCTLQHLLSTDEHIFISKSSTLNIEFHYLQLNTLFRYKINFKNTMFYASVGPKIDILLSTENFNKAATPVNYGLKPSIGFYELINSRLSLGLNVSYLMDFNTISNNKTIFNNIDLPSEALRSKTYNVMASLKYSL